MEIKVPGGKEVEKEKAKQSQKISQVRSFAIAGLLVKEAAHQCLLGVHALARPRGYISASFAFHRAIRTLTARLDAEGRSELKDSAVGVIMARL